MTNPTTIARSLSEAEVAIADMGAAFADTVKASWNRSEPRAVIAGRRFVAASQRAQAAVRAAILAEHGGWGVIPLDRIVFNVLFVFHGKICADLLCMDEKHGRSD